ncbi:MAG: thioredoxin family protein [Ferruginibacter sp.]
MKLLFVLLFTTFTFNTGNEWLTDLDQAKKTAVEKNEYILLNFSGSDWCGPCMRLRKEIFESAEFKKYADEHLVLVNADFPRNKKNELSKEQQKKNDQLAEQYNPNGKFPFTILLDAQGKIVKEWDGLPDLKPGGFVNQITQISGKGK